MRKYMLTAGFIGAATFGMDRPSVAGADQKLSITHIQEAYLKISHSREAPSKEHKKALSDQLFWLSVNWTDRFGIVGLSLAKALLEKGADPHYPQIEHELLANKQKTMLVAYTQTASSVCSGKLLMVFKFYMQENTEE